MAQRYAETSQWQYDRAMALLALCPPAAGDAVLDIGCGTGGVTFEIARRVGAGASIFAIDPDADRLAVARASAPSDAALRFIETIAERLDDVPDAAVDYVYSSYVFHWVADKPRALAEALRCMRSGARMAVEAVGVPGKPQIDLCEIAGPGGQRRIKRFLCPTEGEWRALLESAGFVIEHFAWPELPFDFPSFEVFLSWWEGTTHGDVVRENIAPEALEAMRSQYPERVQYTAPSIQFVVRKP
ncbi:MAG: hypothetical protein Tsb0020_04170 [Haliangiales bacterium]